MAIRHIKLGRINFDDALKLQEDAISRYRETGEGLPLIFRSNMSRLSRAENPRVGRIFFFRKKNIERGELRSGPPIEEGMSPITGRVRWLFIRFWI